MKKYAKDEIPNCGVFFVHMNGRHDRHRSYDAIEAFCNVEKRIMRQRDLNR